MRFERVGAFLVLAGAAAFVVLVGLLHVLQPENNGNHALSEYALGDFGWLMNAAFVGTSSSPLALAGWWWGWWCAASQRVERSLESGARAATVARRWAARRHA